MLEVGVKLEEVLNVEMEGEVVLASTKRWTLRDV